MPTDEQIQYDVSCAIPLPQCPVKREHAIASRIWLVNKINEYLSEVKAHYEQDKSGFEKIANGVIE